MAGKRPISARSREQFPDIEADDGEVRSIDLSGAEVRRLQELVWALGYRVHDTDDPDINLIASIVERWAGYAVEPR